MRILVTLMIVLGLIFGATVISSSDLASNVYACGDKDKSSSEGDGASGGGSQV